MNKLTETKIVDKTPAISIVVNDSAMQVEPSTTIDGLLQTLALRSGVVAVERNGQVVPSLDHSSTRLAEGDRLEVVSLTGGG